MTVKISGTTISLTRGDTLKVKIDISNPDGSAYEPLEGDSIRFAMKAKYNDQTPIILKDISTSDLELVLDPADTKDLKQPSDSKFRMKGDLYRMKIGTPEREMLDELINLFNNPLTIE